MPSRGRSTRIPNCFARSVAVTQGRPFVNRRHGRRLCDAVSAETDIAPSPTPETGAEGGRSPEDGSQAPSDGGEGGSQGPNDDRDESGRYIGREAARWRTQLREVERERDSLREQLDRAQTAEVERLAQAAGLAVPQDVWLHGASLANLRTEDGDIDGDTVTAMVGDLLKGRPGLQAPKPGHLGIGWAPPPRAR